MNLTKVKILKSIKSIKTGYGLTGSARTMVQQVHDWIAEQPKAERSGWIELFDVLCATAPSRVTGGGWLGGMTDLAKEVSDVAVEKPAGGMTLEEIKAMHEETEARAQAAPAEEGEDAKAHAAIIASAGVEPSETAGEIEAAEDEAEAEAQAEAHAAIIASADNPEDAARAMLSGE